MARKIEGGHIIYCTGDDGAPDAIKDRNGEVALALCLRCGAGESELDDGPCIPAATLAGLRDGSLVAVPVEPTEAMIGAGGASHDHPSVFMGGPSHNGRDKARRIYRAMLAAAQEPQHD